MSKVLAVLLVGILVLVYCTSCSTGPVASAVKKLKSKISGKCGCPGEGMSVKESVRVVKKLGNVFDREDVANSDVPYAPGMKDQYDPINMGALKQTEIDAHKRGIAEMAPFQSYGPAAPNKVIRDDNDWLRSTGVPFVGGMPRALKRVASGPQAGARQTTSTSEKDIYMTHLASMNEPTWG